MRIRALPLLIVIAVAGCASAGGQTQPASQPSPASSATGGAASHAQPASTEAGGPAPPRC